MAKYDKHGGVRHLRIETADDFKSIIDLHPALWAATSAPISSFNINKNFINYLDTDKNNRIICEEVINAVDWILGVLSEYSGINNKEDKIQKKWINNAHQDSKSILTAIDKIKFNTNNSDECISYEQVLEIKSNIEKNPVSESGIAILDAVHSNDIKDYMKLVIDITGGEEHPTGSIGVNIDCLNKFDALLNKYLEWSEKKNCAINEGDVKFLPFKEKTECKFEVFSKIENKVNQYFKQNRSLQYRKALLGETDPCKNTDFDVLTCETEDDSDVMLSNLPLAAYTEKNVINLSKTEMINPYYQNDLINFNEEFSGVLKLNNNILDESAWQNVKDLLEPFKNWVDSNPVPMLTNYPINDLKKMSDPKIKNEVLDIIRLSEKTAYELNNIRLLEKLILFQKYMLQFLNNFTSLSDFYNPKINALFDQGSLIIDGREMCFSILVEDKVKHMKMIKNSNIFSLYVDVFPVGEDKYSVVVPVTKGKKGNLTLGKRGIFIDIHGKESDAVVTDIIEYPICLREALAYPFRKINSIYSSSFDSFSKEADKNLTKSTTDLINGKGNAKEAQTSKISPLNLTSLIMGGGIAIAALGSSLTYIFSVINKTSFLKIIIGFACVIIAILFFSLLNAFFRLRKRNLAPVLEGSDWALNIKIKLNRTLTKNFVKRPKWSKK